MFKLKVEIENQFNDALWEGIWGGGPNVPREYNNYNLFEKLLRRFLGERGIVDSEICNNALKVLSW